jgi:hypothetical protein
MLEYYPIVLRPIDALILFSHHLSPSTAIHLME